MKKHRPSHLFEDNQIYFLTGRTYGKIPHLAGDEAKNIFKNSLFEKTKKFDFKLYAWTIMDNHYHILIDENLDGRGLKPATPGGFGLANFSSRQEERAVNRATSDLRGLKPATSNQRTVNRATSNQRAINCATSSSNIPKFIRELHGTTSFKIKKIPAWQILNEEQIAYREKTPMEDRIEKRLEKIIFEWARAINCATSEEGEVADFSLRQEKERGLKPATSNQRALKCATPVLSFEVAKFISRLKPNQRKRIEKIIRSGDLELAKTLLAFYLPQHFNIPFWYQYTDHVIRNEKDFYCHLNYIHQNCVKHGLSEKVFEYKFSSYHDWLKRKGQEWMRGVLEKYPIIDFGGKWLE